ncbi:hypothetical protein ACNKHT_13160 [Shigella flexneri]
MVKAGAGTDAAIDYLFKPYLDKGDIIIDGGDTLFPTSFVVTMTSAEGFDLIIPY